MIVRALVPPGAPQVYLTGSASALGPWRADALAMEGTGAERVARLRLPAGERLEFKVTLGDWAREGLGPSGTVMPNQVLVADAPKTVTIQVTDFKKDVNAYLDDPAGSGVVGRLVTWRDPARNVQIWLPPAYDADPARRFPVLYMQDGQNLFDPRIANTGVDWGVDEAIMALSERGEIEPWIVVAVWSTAQRRQEYAPTKVLERLPAAARAAFAADIAGAQGADAYVRYLVEDVKPRVDAAFRTRPGRADTAIAGSSMGGLISLYAMAERPDIFAAAAGLSIHWPVTIQRETLENDAWRAALTPAFEDYLASARLDPARQRLWLDRGGRALDAFYAPYEANMREAFTRLGYREGATFAMRVYPEAEHNEAAWRARLQEVLRFLLAPRPKE